MATNCSPARAKSFCAPSSNRIAEEKTDWSVIKEKIRVDLRRYLKKQTSKRPLILPVILEL